MSVGGDKGKLEVLFQRLSDSQCAYVMLRCRIGFSDTGTF